MFTFIKLYVIIEQEVLNLPNNSRAINRVFTKKVMADLIRNGSNEVYNTVVDKYVIDPIKKTNGEIISEIYNYLQDDYII